MLSPVLDPAREHVRHGLHPAVRVPGKAGQVVLRPVAPEVVEHQERVEPRELVVPERSAEPDPAPSSVGRAGSTPTASRTSAMPREGPRASIMLPVEAERPASTGPEGRPGLLAVPSAVDGIDAVRAPGTSLEGSHGRQGREEGRALAEPRAPQRAVIGAEPAAIGLPATAAAGSTRPRRRPWYHCSQSVDARDRRPTAAGPSRSGSGCSSSRRPGPGPPRAPGQRRTRAAR